LIYPNWVTTPHPLSLLPVSVNASRNAAADGVAATSAGFAVPVFRVDLESREIAQEGGYGLCQGAVMDRAASCPEAAEICRVLGRTSP